MPIIKSLSRLPLKRNVRRLLRRYDEMTEPSVRFEPLSSSRVLLISFGGFYGRMGIPPFEFSRITADLDVSRLYVRDFDRCFYHRGLRGHSSDIDTTASQLAKYVALADAERVVCIGQSMGAYAALLFGALINADEVHAFVPRTLIAFEAGQLINLPAMRKHLRKLERYPHVQDKYFDLLDLFRSTGFVSPSHIYHGLEHPNDKWHATRMASAPNVTVHVVNHNRHSITAALRDSGELTRILQAAIRGEVVGNGG